MIQQKKISMAQGQTNRHYANGWDLDNGNFLAFLADAPSHAEQRTGMYIRDYLEENKSSIKNTLSHLEPESIQIMMADIATGISDELLKIGKGNAYSTLCLVLVYNEYIYSLCVGDSAVYILGKSPTRLSEITRINSRSFIDGTIPDEPARYKEYSYIGDEKRVFSQNDVFRLTTDGVRLVVLVSDGAEIQFGIKNLYSLINREDSIENKEKSIKDYLNPDNLADDVTVLLVEVPTKPPANPVILFRGLLNDIQNRLNTQNTAFKNHIDVLIKQIDALNNTITQKADNSKLDETIEATNNRFRSVISKINKAFGKKQPLEFEKESGELNFEGFEDKIEGMIDNKATALRKEIGDIKRDMRSILHQPVEDPKGKHKEVTLYQLVNELVNDLTIDIRRKTVKYVSNTDIEKYVKDIVASQIKLLPKMQTAADPGTLKETLETSNDDNKDFKGQQEGIVSHKEPSSIKGFGKRFFKYFKGRELLRVARTILISLIIIVVAFYLYQHFSPTTGTGDVKPKDQKTTTGKQNDKKTPPDTQIQAFPPKPGEETKAVIAIPDGLDINLSYLSSKFKLDKNNYRVYENNPTVVCKDYIEFLDHVKKDSVGTILLPISQAVPHWSELLNENDKEYKVPNQFKSLSSNIIPKAFLVKKVDFIDLQVKKKKGKIGETFKYNTGETFYYPSIYYRVTFTGDNVDLQKTLDAFGLTETDFKYFNPGIDTKKLKGQTANIPLAEKWPEFNKPQQ